MVDNAGLCFPMNPFLERGGRAGLVPKGTRVRVTHVSTCLG